MSDPLPFREKVVFATCAWCPWKLHRLPSVPLLGKVVAEVRCENSKCRKPYLLLIETTGTALTILAKRKLEGTDARHYRAALLSFGGLLNEDEVAAWCEIRERAIEYATKVSA